MDHIDSCSKCDSILVKSYQATQDKKCFELALSSALEFSRGPDSCNFFKTLIKECRWSRCQLGNSPDSRIAIQFDDHIDSTYHLSVATLPRPPRRGYLDSLSSRDSDDLWEWDCQIVTNLGMISRKNCFPSLPSG
jgi:hypothetical protein